MAAKKKSKKTAKKAAKRPAKKKAAASKKPAKKKAAPAKKKAAAKPATSSKAAAWRKLNIKAGPLLHMNEPPGVLAAWLAGSQAVPFTHQALIAQHGANAQVATAWLFVHAAAFINGVMSQALPHLGPSTNLIVSYKKGNDELHRDTLWEAMKPHGFEGVALVAVDDEWSGMRFRRAA